VPKFLSLEKSYGIIASQCESKYLRRRKSKPSSGPIEIPATSSNSSAALQTTGAVETMMELKEAITAVDTSADEEGSGSANKRQKI
jgi:hypothetical protein